MAAQDDNVIKHGQLVGGLLVENLAIGSGENHFVIITLGAQGADGSVHRFNLYYHTGLAAKGIVVDFAVAIGGIIAEVVDVYFRQTLVAGTADYGAAQGRLQHLGKHGDDVYAHNFAKLRIFFQCHNTTTERH